MNGGVIAATTAIGVLLATIAALVWLEGPGDGSCRYCGRPADPGHRECDECYQDNRW